MDPYSERWSMIPTVQSQSNPNTPSNQDQLFLQQQQLNQQLYPQQPPQQQQSYQQQQPPPQQESLASHFHLLHLVENLADAIENGTRDQHSDALTVEEQKRKQEEAEDLLNQRRHLISNYRSSIEDLIATDK